MKDALRQQFQRLELRLSELDATLADPAVAGDMKRYRAMAREQAQVQGVVETFRRYEGRERDLAAAQEMQDDPELAEMAAEEIAAAAAAVDGKTEMEALVAYLQGLGRARSGR